MGFIIDTNDDLLVLERRRESYIVMDRNREYQLNSDEANRDPRKQAKSEHIFVACDGEIEISAEFLYRLVKYFVDNPAEMKELETRR